MPLDIDPAPVRGVWFRHVPAGGAPLFRPERPADGRWQRGDAVEGFSLADSDETAWAEWYRALAEFGIPPMRQLPRDLWQFELDIDRVADLSSPEQLVRVGLPDAIPDRRQWAAFQGVGESLIAPLMPDDVFDPIAVLQALDQHRVACIVIGALGRVIHGSGEVTSGIDLVPSMREENLRRLGLALDDVNARHLDGARPALDRDLPDQSVLALRTSAGEVKVVPMPAGTRGYDDLRRGARREPLGRGVRPAVASLGDHARMLAALDHAQALPSLRTVRRLIELEHGLGRGHGIEL